MKSTGKTQRHEVEDDAADEGQAYRAYQTCCTCGCGSDRGRDGAGDGVYFIGAQRACAGRAQHQQAVQLCWGFGRIFILGQLDLDAFGGRSRRLHGGVGDLGLVVGEELRACLCVAGECLDRQAFSAGGKVRVAGQWLWLARDEAGDERGCCCVCCACARCDLSLHGEGGFAGEADFAAD